MGRVDSPSEIVRNAPPRYFIARAQQHRGFYGTEFGYACWYIKASMGYSLGRLQSGGSSKPVADFLESILANFDLRQMKLFPRSLPFEFGENQFPLIDSGSQSPSTSDTSAVSDSEESGRSTPPSPSHEHEEPEKAPNSSGFDGSENAMSSTSSEADVSPRTSASSVAYNFYVPENTPAASMYIDKRRGLVQSHSQDASIFAELAERANAVTLSLDRDTARSPDRKQSPRSSRRPGSPVPLGGARSYGSSSPGTLYGRGRKPNIRVVSPNGASQSPPPVETRRRPSPYPVSGELWKRISARRSSSLMPLSLPPPSPREDAEEQSLSLPLSPGDVQGIEQPFITPGEIKD